MSDIIIIGPSNSGKTYIGNYFASRFSLPVFNCDSVQIYKFLNSVTSKPVFADQTIREGEVVSTIYLQIEFDIQKYQNTSFKVYERENGELVSHEFYVHDFLDFINNYLTKKYAESKKDEVDNYLFDIKEPLESYSSYEFECDVKRIVKKFDLKNKIIVGGTIYYVYNHIFHTNNELNIKNDALEGSRDYSVIRTKDSIEILKKYDPEALEIIDVKNRRRVETAAKFVIESGRKYSSEYFRPHKPLDNFLLIILNPKDRKEYYKSLDNIIDERLNKKTFEELDFIVKKYGPESAQWLEKLSYEYKYFLQIHSLFGKNGIEYYSLNPVLSQEIQEILQILKYKEHQYAKRQMTFIRRLERKLIYGTTILSST